MKLVEIKVKGIMCNGCIQKINNAIDGTDGIEKVNVSTNMEKVTVSFDEGKLSESDITNIIENIEGTNFKVIG